MATRQSAGVAPKAEVISLAGLIAEFISSSPAPAKGSGAYASRPMMDAGAAKWMDEQLGPENISKLEEALAAAVSEALTAPKSTPIGARLALAADHLKRIADGAPVS